METATLIVVLVIVLALFFDLTNGFHDTAKVFRRGAGQPGRLEAQAPAVSAT